MTSTNTTPLTLHGFDALIFSVQSTTHLKHQTTIATYKQEVDRIFTNISIPHYTCKDTDTIQFIKHRQFKNIILVLPHDDGFHVGNGLGLEHQLDNVMQLAYKTGTCCKIPRRIRARYTSIVYSMMLDETSQVKLDRVLDIAPCNAEYTTSITIRLNVNYGILYHNTMDITKLKSLDRLAIQAKYSSSITTHPAIFG
ncbi:Hypothetical protein MVR_LOCUS80 [uncultured virus]|nr:Hypothetical protein MVR_LOCUS80 [uncultured virus]